MYLNTYSNDKCSQKVLWMNLEKKETVIENKNNFFPKLASQYTKISSSVEQLCILKADENDIVILRNKPPQEVLESIFSLKGFLPRILYCDDDSDDFSKSIIENKDLMFKLKHIVNCKKNRYVLEPFKVSDSELELSKLLGIDIIGNILPICFDVNDKIVARNLALKIGGTVPQGFECYSLSEIKGAVDKLRKTGKVVIKDSDSVSGQGMLIIDDNKSEKIYKALIDRRKSNLNFRVVVEQWYDNCVDINYQILIDQGGEVTFFYPTCQIVKKGVYNGTDFQIENYLNNEEVKQIKEFGIKLSKYLVNQNYYGYISVDSIKKRDELFSLVEINARMSLSTYFLNINKYLKNKKVIVQYYDKKDSFELNKFYQQFSVKNNKCGTFILSCGLTENFMRIFILYFANDSSDLQDLKSRVELYLEEC